MRTPYKMLTPIQFGNAFQTLQVTKILSEGGGGGFIENQKMSTINWIDIGALIYINI